MEASKELMVAEHGELAVSREPEIVLQEASRAAAALAKVISSKKKKVMFNNEQYLEFEDWQTVAKFYGLTAKVIRTDYIECGPARGFKASAVALQVATGREVSEADSMCLNDEDNWSTRAKYEWHYVKKSGGTSLEDPGKDELIWEKSQDGKSRPKKTRVKIGDEPVPMFQLLSMAQTRACAKALRNALSWVVVLAGYKPTPAEELPGAHIEDNFDAPKVTADVATVAADDDIGDVHAVTCSTHNVPWERDKGGVKFHMNGTKGCRQDVLLYTLFSNHAKAANEDTTKYLGTKSWRGMTEAEQIKAVRDMESRLKTILDMDQTPV